MKAKHIDVRLKFVQDYARRGIIAAQHVRSEAQLGNLMTKAVDAFKLASPCKLVPSKRGRKTIQKYVDPAHGVQKMLTP